MKESLTKSKVRVKELGEVFTPAACVSKMLDKLPAECELPDKTFLEPSCGTGNFLVSILQRKLANGHPIRQALSTIYAIDIMQDNVIESRKRLLRMALDAGLDLDELAETVKCLKHNIVVGNTLELDFSGDWPPKPIVAARQRATPPRSTQPRAERVSRPKLRVSSYSPLEPMLPIALVHIPAATINSKSAYTAVSLSGRNLCYANHGHNETVIFKLDKQKLYEAFGVTVTLPEVRDGKRTWPAVKIDSQAQLDAYTPALHKTFAALAEKYCRR